MNSKNTFPKSKNPLIITTLLILTIGTISSIGLLLSRDEQENKQQANQNVLGKLVMILSTPTPEAEFTDPIEQIGKKDKETVFQTVGKEQQQSSAYKISIAYAPKELNEGDLASFTWDIDGPSTTINHTSIHFGTVSNEGELSEKVIPSETRYTDMIRDFVQGEYSVPFRFVGNKNIVSSGLYYFRAHALINDKNYWSNEYVFEVKLKESKSQQYTITLVYLPKEIRVNGIATFTWDIGGPSTTISHTAIYFGSESRSGKLAIDIKPEDTPYNYLVSDFVQGKYNIPLRFVGNKTISTPGKYFFRVYALINGKNLWTDEYFFEVTQ